MDEPRDKVKDWIDADCKTREETRNKKGREWVGSRLDALPRNKRITTCDEGGEGGVWFVCVCGDGEGIG